MPILGVVTSGIIAATPGRRAHPQLLRRKVLIRHQRAGLDALRILDPAGRFPGLLSSGSRRERAAARDVREVGRRDRAGERAANLMAQAAAIFDELPARAACIRRRRCACRSRVACSAPLLECRARLGNHLEAHVRVLQAAVLGALAPITSGAVGLAAS